MPNSSADARGDIDSHTEGVLLFSDSRECYGRSLAEIIDEMSSDIKGYGESIAAEPHTDGWEMIRYLMENTDVHGYFLDNSVWLIHHECLQDDEYAKDFQLLIRGVPPEANIIVWVDEDQGEGNNILRDIETQYPRKVTVVKSEARLKHEIQSYLDYSINPGRGFQGTLQDWKRKVRQKKEDIG